MKINLTLEGQAYQITTRCTGCPCHDYGIQMGRSLNDGCCGECGCPKTADAFFRLRGSDPRTDRKITFDDDIQPKG